MSGGVKSAQGNLSPEYLEVTYQSKVIKPNFITSVSYKKPFLNLSFHKVHLQQLSEQKKNAVVSRHLI